MDFLNINGKKHTPKKGQDGKRAETPIWARLGATLFPTMEEVDILCSAINDAERHAVLKRILSEGRFQFDGESYIPQNCVEDFNDENGTDYEPADYEFSWM